MSSNLNIINSKCSNCKCYFIPTIKSSGLSFKTCDKCRTKDKETRRCEHDKRKSVCKECGGGSICEHNKIKSRCKACGGSQICEHNKRKSVCKECGGGSICEHNKIKSKCKSCGGSEICEHGKQKSQCKACEGNSICEHNKIKSGCKACGGSQICEHNKIKSLCKTCGGSQICEHGKQKRQCKECNFKLYLINLQRVNINRCFKISKSSKTKQSIEYLGCSIEEFIQYFQKKIDYFNTYLSTDEQMTFNKIHIDHIKPVSKFNLDDEDEFLDCCHYSNLQPLLSNTNLEKHNKWNDENDKYWTENIKGKDYHEIYIP